MIDMLDFNMAVARSDVGQQDSNNGAKDHNRNRMGGGGFKGPAI
jgi:hypothetical protein